MVSYSQDTSKFKDVSSSATDRLSSTAANIADKATAKIGDAIESAETTAASLVESGRDAGDRVQKVAGNFKTAVHKSVRDQPLTTLAVAAAAGFVLGALWKS